jgi:hypothetical protein
MVWWGQGEGRLLVVFLWWGYLMLLAVGVYGFKYWVIIIIYVSLSCNPFLLALKMWYLFCFIQHIQECKYSA